MPAKATKDISSRGILIPKKNLLVREVLPPREFPHEPPDTLGFMLYAGRPYKWERLERNLIRILAQRPTNPFINMKTERYIKVQLTKFFLENVRVFHGRL